MEFLENSYFLLALTFIVFILARIINKRTGLILLNPILISVTVLILFLWLTGIPYETYTAGGGYVEFWLKPAVVALGVPLYRQLSTIRKQLLPILAAELAGCVAGIVSVVVVAQAMGATREVVLSLAAKSVTTPIAMEVTAAVGGIPPLTAAVVVCVGIFGGMTGFRVMTMTHITSPMARGLAMGTAAHALGTSAAIDTGGHRYGAWASLGLTLNGLFTALLAPTILELLGA